MIDKIGGYADEGGPLVALRCASCGALLARHQESPGLRVEIRCHRCKTLNVIRIPRPPPSTSGGPAYEKRG